MVGMGIVLRTFLLLVLSCSIMNGMSEYVASSWSNKAIGEIGEGMMRAYFQYTGWEQIKVPTPNSLNGLDGVFVKKTPSGSIKDVIIVESKVNSSQEGILKTGERQGSKAYNLKKIDIGISLATDKHLKEDLIIIKEKINKDLARSIEHRVEFSNSRVKITHRTLTSPKDINSIVKGPLRTVADFDFTAPKNPYEKFISKSIIDETTKFLSNPNKNIPLPARQAIINELGIGNDIRNAIYNGLKEIPDVRAIPKGFNIKGPEGKVFARTSQKSSLIRVSNSISLQNALGSSIKTASLTGGITFAFESGDALYKYINSDISTEELYSRMRKGLVDGVTVAGSTTIVQPVLAAILPDGRLLCATEYGMFVVAIEMGLASVELWNGNIDFKEFKKKATESIIKGATVGGVSYAALYLGATPGGLTVFAIGVGGYLIADLGIKEYKRRQWVHQTNVKELAMFGIINKDNPFIIGNPNNPLERKNTDSPFEMINSDNPF